MAYNLLQLKKVFISAFFIAIAFSAFSQSADWYWGQQGTPFPKSDGWGMSVATDKWGNAYHVGSYDVGVTFGAFNLVSTSIDDGVYLVKYNSAGTVRWVRQGTMYNNNESEGQAVTTDDSGYIYVTGYFWDTIQFGNTPMLEDPSWSTYNVFLVKYDTNGNALWAIQSHAHNLGQALSYGVSADNHGGIYVTGNFTDTVMMGTDTLRCKDFNAFVMKYDKWGNFQWARQSTPSGPTDRATAYCVAADSTGNAYVAGLFKGTVSFGATQLAGAGNMFIVKYSPAGNALWANQSHAAVGANATSYGIAVDSFGGVYTCGDFNDTVTFGATTLLPNIPTYNRTFFLAKYTSNGSFEWAKQGQPLDSNAWTSNGISTDHRGHEYLVGGNNTHTSSNTKLKFGNDTVYLNLTGNTSTDPSILFELDTAGRLLCKTIMVDGSYENAVASDPTGNYVYMTGTGNETFNAPPLIFGTNSLSGGVGGVYPYVARWQTCCGVINDFVSSIDDTCNKPNGIAFAHASGTFGPFSYSWSPAGGNDSVAQSLTAGTYTLTVTNANGCFKTDQVVIASYKNLNQPNVFGTDDTCNKPNGIASAHESGPTGPFNYSWSPAGGNDSIATSLTAGTYIVRITDVKGCIITDTVVIASYNIPVSVNVCCDTTLTIGDSVTLNVNTTGNYIWTPSAGLSCDTCANPIATPTVTTEYIVTASNQQGCRNADSVLITVNDKPCHTLFVPNAFSPNGDNVNDVEYVYGDCIQSLDFKIFDRWGNKVFETTDQSVGWDGRYKGQPASSDVYDYTLIVTQSNGKTTSLKGNITLVR
jgi:gliding motility-associated-like protein